MVWDISMVLIRHGVLPQGVDHVILLDSLSDIQSVQKRIQRLAGPS